MASHFPLPAPVLSALQYLMAYETELNGPDAEPTELTDSIVMLAMFIAHVTNTDADHLFDTDNGGQITVEANQYHTEPETMQ